MDGFIAMLPEPFQKLSSHMDFPGQQAPERTYQVILVISGIIGFFVGYSTQQLSHAVYTVLAGAALSAFLVVPPWPFLFRKNIQAIPEISGIIGFLVGFSTQRSHAVSSLTPSTPFSTVPLNRPSSVPSLALPLQEEQKGCVDVFIARPYTNKRFCATHWPEYYEHGYRKGSETGVKRTKGKLVVESFQIEQGKVLVTSNDLFLEMNNGSIKKMQLEDSKVILDDIQVEIGGNAPCLKNLRPLAMKFGNKTWPAIIVKKRTRVLFLVIDGRLYVKEIEECKKAAQDAQKPGNTA